jgi:L-arabinose isomerase
VLFLYVPTYALSGVVLPLIQRAGVPVIVLNLQPTAAIDYAAFNRLPDCRNMTGHWLAYCSACPVPEIATSSSERGSHFIRVTGVLGEEQTSREIQEWLAAARVFTLLRESRLGLLGHYYSGMLDVATDITQVSITFGCDIEILEVDELSALRFAISEEAVTARVELIRDHFDVQADCPASELARAARTSVALDQFLEVYHGKIGRGLSVEMSVRHGPVTLLSVAEDQQHGFRFLISEGTCEDGPTLVIGNTNSRYRFPMGTKAFLEQWNACGPAHHCAIGVGHLAGHLTKLASLLEIPLHQVC